MPVAPDGMLGFLGAGSFFSMTIPQTVLCFGSHAATRRYHGHWLGGRVRPSDLSRPILALPEPSNATHDDFIRSLHREFDVL